MLYNVELKYGMMNHLINHCEQLIHWMIQLKRKICTWIGHLYFMNKSFNDSLTVNFHYPCTGHHCLGEWIIQRFTLHLIKWFTEKILLKGKIRSPSSTKSFNESLWTYLTNSMKLSKEWFVHESDITHSIVRCELNQLFEKI